METLLIRFLIGGLVVSLFAVLGISFAQKALPGYSEPHRRSLWQRSVLPSFRTENLTPLLNVAP